MDAGNFDRFARLVGQTRSRRVALGGLLAGFASNVGDGAGDVAARKKKTCPRGLRRCNGRCKDLSSDSANCGRCRNVCPTGGQCQAGACICPPGTTTCGGACVDLLTDAANCGACGIHCTSNACLSGACKCAGDEDCPGACKCDARLEGSKVCVAGAANTQCVVDRDCLAGSVCLMIKKCSLPCNG
ncbi:MAG: hypothetical protein U0031_00195 [Thermomicrobiales bacterium]